MAIAAGKSSAAADFSRYVGVASCSIVAINPSKKEMEALYSREMDKDPEYLGEAENADGKTIKTVRISFVVKPDVEKYGVDVLLTHTYFLRGEYRFNRDKTKVQVIDKYGRTAWVTIEQAKNHEIPMYTNGPANLDKDYRPCYVGEEELTQFLINYLNIPSVMRYDRENNKWYLVDNPQDSECRLDEIANYFKGDITELKSAIALQPNNQVKILFTVRMSDDNKQFQGSYTRMTLKNSVRDYSNLDKNIQEMKNSSTSSNIANTVYDVTDFHKYEVVATAFTPTEESVPISNPLDEMPFSM